jgi:predicted ATPase
MDRLSVVQAASVLGVTQAAVYKRIQRGTIAHYKDSEGRVFVHLDASDIPSDKSMDTADGSTDRSMTDSDASTDEFMDRSNPELVAELRAHNEHLRLEVEAWREESRRKDAILMTMAQRIPELEAASEPRESSQTSSEEQGSGAAVHPQDGGTEKRSWWRQFFGFE